MRGWLAALLVVSAGCIGFGDEELPLCEGPGLDTFHGDAGGAIPKALDEPVPIVYWATNPLPDPATLYPHPLGGDVPVSDPTDPSREPDHAIAVEANGSAFGGILLTGEELGVARFQVELFEQPGPDGGDPACEGDPLAVYEVPIAPVASDAVGTVGKGILVHTVGWWTNGTSFYTNSDRYNDRAELPRSYLGDYGGGEPLHVYVYGDSREEMPPRYERAGYFTTIAGFNEALKGMTVGSTRVAYLEPEEAYTLEGREDHPLYGEPLIFYIEALEVVDLPCEVPQPVCDIPNIPEPPAPHLLS